MSSDREDCGRAARLLARMEAAPPEHEDDPASVLAEDDAEWLAAHLAACASCATSDEDAVAPLFAALRAQDRADVPDDLFFAARRRAILSEIGAGPVAAARVGAEAAPAAAPQERRTAARRTAWLAVGAALAASIALLLAVPRWRDADLVSDRPTVGVPPPADEITAFVASLDPAELAAAEDAWLLASSDFLGLDPGDAREHGLDELSDEELDEIEGVFVSVQGWS